MLTGFSERLGLGMGDVVKFKKPKAFAKSKGRTLCKSGFHKWRADSKPQFDVKRGKLVTRWVCQRCGETKVEAR